MFRGILKLLSLAVLVVAGASGIYIYQQHASKDHRIRQLLDLKQALQRIVERLSAETRRAEILVTDQKKVDGKLQTTLLFVEYAKDGSSLPPRSFVVEGKWIHIDALVIKFDSEDVGKADPLRGHSICLFTRLYGDYQTPADGPVIDQPGKIPDIYRGTDPDISDFEQNLWQNFWKLAEDPAYRQQQKVRIANGQGLWGPFVPGRIYTITLEANGGMNLHQRPIEAIYQDALKRPTM